ncbi:Hint domain-containing protein [Ruegeria sediminis]|uniref:Hint domain-containing protein n=1 Tax=Ruegeria sediminis TaxID=2583820 RepID=A0ABY2X1F5_9RHOB|nr:Hint domain-containing protein [Ruegeria sediminis]TMV08718.1 Hint domain-containing protein [Ruegeria sediminis]
MPRTFNAIFLGNLADIDTVEGNNIAENAAALVGMTFGGPGDALLNRAVEWKNVGNPGDYYNMNNSPADRFSIDGGPAQTYDASVTYYATITYIDGTTASITAVVAQDVAGNTYLVPEFQNNADQSALEAKGIRSLRLDNLESNVAQGLTSSRQSWNIVTCFCSGTMIETEQGERPIESLKPGDLVSTLDNGLQPVRWIGHRTVSATGSFAPVLFRAGALENSRDLKVSQQHRMLLRGWRLQLYTGHDEALVPAKHLVNGRNITLEPGGFVTYYHLLFDRHEVIMAEGCPSESFHPGDLSWGILGDEAHREITTLFPELAVMGPVAYGPSARPSLRAHEALMSVA